MTDTSQEIYVYIVPVERRNGDEPSCRVLIKGNTHPQQIRGTAENYIKYLMKSMVSTTGKEGACHALHEGAKTSRGKVCELPNGQFLSPYRFWRKKEAPGMFPSAKSSVSMQSRASASSSSAANP